MINIVENIKKYAKDDNRLAIICEDRKLTYYEVDKFSDRFANYILENYNSKTPILIFGNKNVDIIPTMIGSLKTGRAYVPVDISSSFQRLVDIVELINPEIIVDFSGKNMFNNSEVKEYFRGIEIIDSDKIRNIFKSKELILNKEIKDIYVKNDENSYILFTSGTTGKPKGVQISAYNLDSFISWISPVLKIDGREKIVMDQPSYSFDLSVAGLYTSLAFGATLYSIPTDISYDFKRLFEKLKKSEMEVWISTPSYANMCLMDDSFNKEILPRLEVMLFIGEVLPIEVARKLKERFPDTRIINGYGPTEATVGISQIEIDDKLISKGKNFPVGIPMDNCRIEIVDKDLKPLPKGQIGEILITGPSVSKGYYKNDEANKKSFFCEDNCLENRTYRTGDLGLLSDDGNIYFFGRIDFQIKLNGYRIEIEDIENNLRKIEGVSSAAVIPVKKDGEVSYLRAVVSLKSKIDISKLKKTIELKKKLSDLVPKYMVPKYFDYIDEMPLNTNGKIDRKKLYSKFVEEM
ncbi:D-alanine--poly(phosphoribitol) ligase subunit DltA [Peptostreptococcus canis]|uniref:D-alanine--poly(Phosphoribitol) ligase subunit DltA n=1 Tax=Peptostreptococcus canis TaxID=1159213 RepID=A0ABR6TK77_9FIRM|nr:D-alanine--poly(phosphoribitol) ligase subunit DltA [Peptostreptococcus canis]MBC2575804.1 D-alanine--poly(phosphoribitol) ligase subunit DltA [Peptostreptococcus canis]MBP1998081.1 D-alanine--poly(phosphoribitol) ligase subunit 1 [Peptostreptococcus canis]